VPPCSSTTGKKSTINSPGFRGHRGYVGLDVQSLIDLNKVVDVDCQWKPDFDNVVNVNQRQGVSIEFEFENCPLLSLQESIIIRSVLRFIVLRPRFLFKKKFEK
jgi:hypothetical protein